MDLPRALSRRLLDGALLRSMWQAVRVTGTAGGAVDGPTQRFGPAVSGGQEGPARRGQPGGPAEPLPEDRFIEREESWLEFNRRVLELAEDPGLPLLERVRFLAVFARNLDEFFMVRVAGLKRRMATGLAGRRASGLQPRELLERIAVVAHELVGRQVACFHSELLPALTGEGIEILRWNDLGGAEQEALHSLFRERIYPVLTPLAVDPAHPFPYISGLSLNLAVVIHNPQTGTDVFARVKVPPTLPRFARTTRDRFVPLEDVIAAHLPQLFSGMEVRQHHAFRVTRNEDLEVDEDETEDLLQALERELMRRRFGPPVRLEVEESIDPQVLDLLVRELEVDEGQVYRVRGPLDLRGLHAIAELDRGELKYQPFLPATHPHLTDPKTTQPQDVFAVLRQRDVLVHHPYDSFATSVQRFLEQAAADPNVLAIKQTLYRTSGDSAVVDALIDAAEAGKQVVVLVELKARFDEEANITWARKLEQAGCHVVYGFIGMKTHCKLALVVRDEPDGSLRRYAHVGTGNYNPKTARSYADFGLLTSSLEVGEDVTDLFNHLTGYSQHTGYRRMLVAPRSLRSGLVARIEREVAHHEAGRPAFIRIKCNAIVDEDVIDALYRAARAGVPVDLWVRGICALRPGVPGLSETIRVRSVVGRILEHSRIFVFGGGGDPEVWMGSADLMHRNLDARVEVLVRVACPDHREQLSRLVSLAMDPGTASWHLEPDGTWCRHHRGADGEPLLDLQEHLLRIQHVRGNTDG